MVPHFTQISVELSEALLDHHVHQGIKCVNGHSNLKYYQREDLPVIFSQCSECDSSFKLYENGDYLAGYLSDDPSVPLNELTCECGGCVFISGVGYEYPGDEESSIDITWFELVAKCIKCGTIQKLFSDETA